MIDNDGVVGIAVGPGRRWRSLGPILQPERVREGFVEVGPGRSDRLHVRDAGGLICGREDLCGTWRINLVVIGTYRIVVGYENTFAVGHRKRAALELVVVQRVIRHKVPTDRRRLLRYEDHVRNSYAAVVVGVMRRVGLCVGNADQDLDLHY